MTINTKFNIKDKVFLTLNFQLIEAEVWSIVISTIKDDRVEIHYEIISNDRIYFKNSETGRLFKQDWLFKTKKELIESL